MNHSEPAKTAAIRPPSTRVPKPDFTEWFDAGTLEAYKRQVQLLRNEVVSAHKQLYAARKFRDFPTQLLCREEQDFLNTTRGAFAKGGLLQVINVLTDAHKESLTCCSLRNWMRRQAKDGRSRAAIDSYLQDIDGAYDISSIAQKARTLRNKRFAHTNRELAVESSELPSNEELEVLIQRTHELTQQFLPESGGCAVLTPDWSTNVESVLGCFVAKLHTATRQGLSAGFPMEGSRVDELNLLFARYNLEPIKVGQSLAP